VLAVAEARVVAAGTGSRRERGRWPAVELPATAAPPLDRLGFTVSVGWRRRRSSCRVPLAPTFFYSAARRGPTSYATSWGAPDQAQMRGGPSGLLGSDGLREINLTVSSLISPCIFLFLLLFSRFVIDLCIKHASSSRSSADRFSSYNARFHSDTDSLTF
jgi:hypothetical protein